MSRPNAYRTTSTGGKHWVYIGGNGFAYDNPAYARAVLQDYEDRGYISAVTLARELLSIQREKGTNGN